MAGKGILHFDGASKGNPGKAGAGAVLMTEDGRVVIIKYLLHLKNFLFAVAPSITGFTDVVT